jgi:cytidine deaminase
MAYELDDPVWAPLIDAARTAMHNAYAPYSKFHVGAALAGGGATIAGCNVENASYGATICAERGAIMSAIARGVRTFDACVVITRGPEPAHPCGMCRQVLNEFAPKLPILLVAESTGARVLVRLDEILPGAFGPSSL